MPMGQRTPSDEQLRRDERWLMERPGWSGGRGPRYSAAIAYPSTYRVGMSNLGLHRLLELTSLHGAWAPLRAFLPPPDRIAALRRSGKELCTFDRDVPLDRPELILATLSYEEDFAGLAQLLRLARLPVRAAQRQDEHPLVVVGGFAAMLNPEPVADLADTFLLGPAERVLGPFLTRVAAQLDRRGRRGLRREAMTDWLGGLEGCYLPHEVRPCAPVRVPSGRPRPDATAGLLVEASDVHGARSPARTRILTPHTEFADRFLVAVGEGCPHGCRFCAAGFARRPPLAFPAEALAIAVDEGLTHSDRIGQMGPAVTDLPSLADLAGQVSRAGADLSTSSLGIPSLIARGLPSQGQTITLAPEVASEPLRRCINKPMTRADVLDAVEACSGADRLRLYFLIGLPGEQDADVDAIAELAAQCRARMVTAGRASGRSSSLVLSVNPFVPKASTPMQWAPMARPEVLTARLERLRRGVRSIGGVSLRAGGARLAMRQAILSLGDRDASEILDLRPGTPGWWPALRRWHADRGDFVFEERDRDHRFPWAHLDRGVADGYLWREWRRARRGELTPPCDVTDCVACGAC